MVGEWEFPEEAEEMKLPVTNNVLGHIVQRLRNSVDPPISEPSLPQFSHFTLKACVLGKLCSGKTACLSKIAEGMISQQRCTAHIHKVYLLPHYVLKWIFNKIVCFLCH